MTQFLKRETPLFENFEEYFTYIFYLNINIK